MNSVKWNLGNIHKPQMVQAVAQLTFLSIFYIRIMILHKLVRIFMRLTTWWVRPPRKLKGHVESPAAFIWTDAGDAGEEERPAKTSLFNL